jgi:prepilin-type N-terminal cleavage/methylation domain-containing protein
MKTISKCSAKRAGFTLFELILAIALSAVLLSLIGMAINLYLRRVDESRSRVEDAQLARSILAMIADDIRATAIYQPQDTSGIAQLMSKTSTFDVDSIDKASDSSSSNATSGATSFSTSSIGAGGASASSSSSTSQTGSSSSGSSTSSDSSTISGTETDNTMPLGVNGSNAELYVDAMRLPRQEELFACVTGYTNAQSPAAMNSAMPSMQDASTSNVAPPADLKTVHYFVRPGEALPAGSAGATSLDPATQSRIGGLVRQETPRLARVFAEQNGGSTVLDSGQALIAPEVVHIEFHYFDGSQTLDSWDMKEQKKLPLGIEVCIWLRPSDATDQPINATADANMLATTRQFKQRVFLPMAAAAGSSQANASNQSSAETSTGNSSNNSNDSSSNSTSSAPGSSF